PPLRNNKHYKTKTGELASALKSLQEKIWCMEVERTKAEQNLKRLGLEASQYKNALEQEKKEVVNVKKICAQLATVEGRCSLLEKQLDYMRNMVVQAETEKNILLEKQASLQLERYWDNAELQSKLEKLEILEQDCFKVNATQDRAEASKIQNTVCSVCFIDTPIIIPPKNNNNNKLVIFNLRLSVGHCCAQLTATFRPQIYSQFTLQHIL
uniref:Cep57 centrosome localisation domain-containing protein n=1 Tax=Callorhinchus milii TaxID=7868 RepID=A0A4W3JC25_CALMI